MESFIDHLTGLDYQSLHTQPDTPGFTLWVVGPTWKTESSKYGRLSGQKNTTSWANFLWIYKCQKQSTFHYQLTLISMYRALREKWKAKQLFEAMLLFFQLTDIFFIVTSRHNFPRRRRSEVFPSCATQPIMGWNNFWKSFVHTGSVNTNWVFWIRFFWKVFLKSWDLRNFASVTSFHEMHHVSHLRPNLQKYLVPYWILNYYEF